MRRKLEKQLSCYIIGEDKLIIQCGEILLAKKHYILGIVSSNLAVQSWAKKHHIAYFNSLWELKEHSLNRPCDYLFSIINSIVLPDWVLALPKYFAVNYHDALLPKYAGVHATSWALLNRERYHGVTWHCMEAELDTGDILKQAKIAVDKKETTLSLNLKCFQLAVETFNILIDELATDSYTRKAQDLKQRTYYAFNRKPFANGWINWDQSAADIERLFRVLQFGDYTNRFSTLKFLVHGQGYIVEELKLSRNKSGQKPGNIVYYNAKQLCIATQTYDLKLLKLRKLNGTYLDIKSFLKLHNLKIGELLPSPSNELQEDYQQMSSAIFKYESFWVKQLCQVNPATLPFLYLEQIKTREVVFFDKFTLSNKLVDQLNTHFSQYNAAKILLAAIFVYLFRINNQEKLSVEISNSSLMQNKFGSLIASLVPLTLSLSDELNFINVIDLVERAYGVINKQKTYLKDIYHRYPELRDAYHILPVSVILDEYCEVNKLSSDGIVLRINKTCIELYIEKNLLNASFNVILKNLFQHLEVILESALANPKQAISHLPILTKEEREKILFDWNNTATSYPKNKTISQLFEEQVNRNPGNIAVLFNKQELTYQQLNQKANQLANYLLAQGVKSGELVAICMERGFEIIIGTLAILKLGAVYVPIDQSYPKHRVDYILKDIRSQFILVDKKNAIRFNNNFRKRSIILVEKEVNYSSSTDNINNLIISAKDTCYIMYTSGSTGQPKGVMASHRNVVRLVKNVNYIKISDTDCMAQVSNFAFDASTFELWGALLNGAKLVVISKDIILNPVTFAAILKANKVSILFLTSALFSQFCKENPQVFRCVPKLLFGGEKINSDIIKNFFFTEKINLSALLHVYGPTESTTFSCCYKVSERIKDLHCIPIGSPIDNAQCYVLDKYLQPVPVGVAAELFIGGEGVAQGYLNQPQQTEQKFILHKFLDDSLPTRLYGSGDIVRWLPDGNLEYVDRQDAQVKIRGFRIELGEIESVLNEYPGVAEVVACIREIDDRKQVEVYFIAKKQKSIKIELVRDYLKGILPSYMLPTHIFQVDNFPLNFNGKVDKQALLRKSDNFSQVSKSIREPIGNVELVLIKAWEKILKINNLDTSANFFSLGGDSITAMQVVAKMSEQGFKVSVKDIFQFPTIAILAKHVKKRIVNKFQRAKLNYKFSLAPIQQWFFAQEFAKPEQFSQVCLLDIKLPINIDRLEQCLQIIIQKYDALSLHFHKTLHHWQQFYIHPELHDKLIQLIDSSKYTSASQLAELIKQCSYQLQENFDLMKGPLVNAAIIIGHSPESAKLLIAIHHLIIDGVSWRIILEQIQKLYRDEISQESLAKISISHTSYQAWIKQLLKYAKSSLLGAEQDFWHAMAKPANALPIDFNKGANLEKFAHSISMELDEYETRQLIHVIPKLYNIKLHEFLAALLVLRISSWAKAEAITLDLESHGREEFVDKLNLAKTVGWFTSLYPVRITRTAGSGWENIRAIQQQLQKIPQNGIGYGLLRYVKSLSSNYQADIALNYWGQFDQLFDGDDFRFEDLSLISHPENKRTHLINVDIVIKNKKLHIIWTYSTHHHKYNTIEELASDYLKDLQTILFGCEKDHNQYDSSSMITISLNQEKIIKKLALANNILDYYPLSPLQKGLLFHALYTPESEAYMVQLIWQSAGNFRLNIDYFQKAWASLIERHEVLRTYFIWEDLNEPIQVVQKQAELPWLIYDWNTVYNEAEQNERLNAFLKSDRQAGFDFSKAPLLRITLIQLPEDQYYCVITCHHILLDGWSLPILLAELEQFYSYQFGETTQFLKPVVPYRNYIGWQQQYNLNQSEQFWKDYLKGFVAPLDLSVITKSHEQIIGKASVDMSVNELRLTKNISDKIKLFCREKQLTLNTIFQAVWALLLNYYSQTDDVLFGVTLTQRSIEVEHSERIIGLMVNTLPLRIELKNNLNVIEYLQEVQKRFSEIMTYHATPLTKVQEWSELSNDVFLFDTILVFENYPLVKQKTPLLKFDNIKIIDPTHYFLTCIIVPGDRILIKLAYDNTRVDASIIKQFETHWILFLTEIIQHPEKLIYQLNTLTKLEQEKILRKWNKTEAIFPADKTLDKLFEEQVEKNPDKIAVVFNNTKINYFNLNKETTYLSRFLQAEGAKTQSLIAVGIERSVELIITILAILKSGSVYVPIDLEYPDGRIIAMFRASATKILLVKRSFFDNRKQLSAELLELGVKIINLDNWSMNYAVYKKPLRLKSNPENLAYVVFTSGSTGIPKAVTIPHRTVVNLINWQSKSFAKFKKSRICQFASIGFDVSIQEIFSALLTGSELYILPAEIKQSIDKVLNFININKINLLMLPTSLLDFFCTEALTHEIKLTKLSAIVVAGETLKITENIRNFFNINQNISLVNHYGPSETHVVSSFTLSGDAKLWSSAVPIGKPIDNCQFYVLDKHFRPVACNIPGQLYIAGLSLGCGYLNQPGMTKQSFIRNPFGIYPVLYKTGDLARWLKDGNLEFIGRINNQIKIRGFRVELDEITAQIEKYTEIQKALVMVREISNNKYLIAYFLTRNNQNISIEKLREFLENYLPNYMVPSAYIKVERFPLTINGKIDEAALPIPTREQFITQHVFEPPTKPTEITLANIWKELLGIPEIGIHDNFFDLGGNSLLALQLLQKIRQYFKADLPIRTLFDAPTIIQLTAILDKENQYTINETTGPVFLSSMVSHFLNLVTLQSLGNKTPLFLIHPVGGTVFWYLPLVKYINFNRPVFGIQDPGLKLDEPAPFKSVEEMASNYIKIIQSIQPRGPYLVGGASAGGTISFEIAHQLLASGEKVAFVGLFDSWVPHPEKLRRQEMFEANMRRQYYQMHQSFAAMGLDQVEPLLKLQWGRVQILDKYLIKPIDTKLTLFKSLKTISVYQSYESPLNHWEKYSSQPIELHLIPGDHETMFQFPHVKTLAYELKRCLELLDDGAVDILSKGQVLLGENLIVGPNCLNTYG